MKYSKILIFLLSIIFTTLLSCTKTVKLTHVPQQEVGSPLSSIEPLNFSISKFIVSPDVTYVKGSGIKIEFDQSVSDTIKHAIADELRRNGHKVLDAKAMDGPDVVLEGVVVNDFEMRPGRGPAATIQAQLKLVRPADTTTILSKTYKGFYAKNTIWLGVSATWRNIFNEALLELIKELTTDQDLFEALQQVRRNR